MRIQALGFLSMFVLATSSPSPMRAGQVGCRGDCGGDGSVTVDEIVTGIDIALGDAPVGSCTAIDANGDLQVTINELLLAVRDLVDGCEAAAPTATPTVAVITTITATATVGVTATPTDAPTALPTETAPPVSTATPTVTVAAATATETAADPTATMTDTVPPEPTATPTATPTPTEPPATTTPSSVPSGLIALIDGDVVLLTWTNADPSTGNARARLLRRLNAPVDGPEDSEAEVVYGGTDNEAGDPVGGLLPSVFEQERIYHYAVYGCTDGGICETVGAATTLRPTLPQVLRAGGYVLHWRHADADVCADQFCAGTAAFPLIPDWWRSCDASCEGPPRPEECPAHSGTGTARQLNDAGRMHATAIGEAFDVLAIPVARVVTSEYCRNFQTAELFDFGPAYELDPGITFYVHDESNRCAYSFDLLAELPAPGANTALIGHTGNDCPPLSTLAWSEAAVFKPDGAGATTFVTRISWERWGLMIPPGPTGLSAAVEGAQVALAWHPPAADSGYHSVRVLRRLNAAVEGPDDAEATEVYAGPEAQAFDPLAGLLPDTQDTPRTYHYAVYGCITPTACERTGSAAVVTPTLVEALRAGGYVIVWRHADADVCADRTDLGPASNPTVPDWWKSCDANCATATARQLSQAGRDHAIAIGAAFDTRGIPVGRVITSEFCRNFQTAELFDFVPTYELNQSITFSVYDEAARCDAGLALASESPAPGTNTAVIGHAGFATFCPTLGSLAWSEAAIFKPDGLGSRTLIRRVTWDQWPTLP